MYKPVHFPQEMTLSVTAFIPLHILDNPPLHPFILILLDVILFIPCVTRDCEWEIRSMTHQKYCVRRKYKAIVRIKYIRVYNYIRKQKHFDDKEISRSGAIS